MHGRMDVCDRMCCEARRARARAHSMYSRMLGCERWLRTPTSALQRARGRARTHQARAHSLEQARVLLVLLRHALRSEREAVRCARCARCAATHLDGQPPPLVVGAANGGHDLSQRRADTTRLPIARACSPCTRRPRRALAPTGTRPPCPVWARARCPAGCRARHRRAHLVAQGLELSRSRLQPGLGPRAHVLPATASRGPRAHRSEQATRLGLPAPCRATAPSSTVRCELPALPPGENSCVIQQ